MAGELLFAGSATITFNAEVASMETTVVFGGTTSMTLTAVATIETTAEIAGSTTLSFAPIWDANRMPITDNTLARLLRP